MKIAIDRKSVKKAYDIRYSKANITKRVIDFNKNSDEDMKILNHLDQKPNKARYVKGLILDDMTRTGE